jgi:hypothetical protein
MKPMTRRPGSSQPDARGFLHGFPNRVDKATDAPAPHGLSASRPGQSPRDAEASGGTVADPAVLLKRSANRRRAWPITRPQQKGACAKEPGTGKACEDAMAAPIGRSLWAIRGCPMGSSNRLWAIRLGVERSMPDSSIGMASSLRKNCSTSSGMTVMPDFRFRIRGRATRRQCSPASPAAASPYNSAAVGWPLTVPDTQGPRNRRHTRRASRATHQFVPRGLGAISTRCPCVRRPWHVRRVSCQMA